LLRLSAASFPPQIVFNEQVRFAGCLAPFQTLRTGAFAPLVDHIDLEEIAEDFAAGRIFICCRQRFIEASGNVRSRAITSRLVTCFNSPESGPSELRSTTSERTFGTNPFDAIS
jgi:hypothetical protein